MAVTVTIWHNPRCSTSRKTLELLRAHGIEPVQRLYLEAPPSRAEIEAVLVLLSRPAADLLRRKEEGAPGPGARDGEILAALAANPRLIERPVVITETGARIGRPPEAVLELF